MYYEDNKISKRVIFGHFENEILFLENGNLRIDYIKDSKIYIVTRKDKLQFDGSERYERVAFYNHEETFDNTLEHLIAALTLVQFIPEAFMFNEFYYEFNGDKTMVIITPIFYKDIVSTSVILEDNIPCKYGFVLRKSMKAIKKLN